MPSLIARASPPPSVGRRILRYYYSRPPNSTPTHQRTISPRSRPTESGSARASFRLRFAPAVFTPSRFLKPAFFIILINLIKFLYVLFSNQCRKNKSITRSLQNGQRFIYLLNDSFAREAKTP